MMANDDTARQQPVENPYGAPQVKFIHSIELNPWTSLWLRPRATIRQIVDTNPNYMVLPLAMASGVVRSWQRIGTAEVLNDVPLGTVVIIMTVVGVILGPLGLFAWGWLIHWTGGWLGGGVATPREARAALAWGHLPAVALIPVFIANMLLFGTDIGLGLILEFQGAFFAFIRAMVLFAHIWTMFSLTKCVAEVHRFSAWRGFFTVLVASFLFLCALTAIFMLIFSVGRSAL